MVLQCHCRQHHIQHVCCMYVDLNFAHRQKEKLAPSMMNLLDSDEEDFNEEEHMGNKPYNQEPEIEPLVCMLLSDSFCIGLGFVSK